MPKIGLGVDVYQAAKDRIKYTFDNFEKISVSFSAGKWEIIEGGISSIFTLNI